MQCVRAPSPAVPCHTAWWVPGSRSGSGEAEQYGVRSAAAEVSGRELRAQLTFPADWGPTEWVRPP